MIGVNWSNRDLQPGGRSAAQEGGEHGVPNNMLSVKVST